eukprot:6481533-Amphidinium_carterae.1
MPCKRVDWNPLAQCSNTDNHQPPEKGTHKTKVVSIELHSGTKIAWDSNEVWEDHVSAAKFALCMVGQTWVLRAVLADCGHLILAEDAAGVAFQTLRFLLS